MILTCLSCSNIIVKDLDISKGFEGSIRCPFCKKDAKIKGSTEPVVWIDGKIRFVAGKKVESML